MNGQTFTKNPRKREKSHLHDDDDDDAVYTGHIQY